MKANYPGLGVGLLPVILLFKLLPYSTMKKYFDKLQTMPLIEFTNLGIIDSSKLVFSEAKITDAFITGAVKYPPFFSMSVCSFNQSLTFSVNHSRTDEAEARVSRFLGRLDQELPH